MRSLNFPAYELRRAEQAGKEVVLDPVRQKWVRLTPEEWVRQHLVQYLIQNRGVPAGLVAVEKTLTGPDRAWRADVVAHDRQSGRPLLVAECKAPEVEITQEPFDQVARYNQTAGARVLVVTNGRDHYCCRREKGTYRFLDHLPRYEELVGEGKKESG
ncbi:MAG: restriction endonuclease subunit R [Bacteroidetes bacterium QS_9_68_14]|nr:MAG: restriction endonuclease subunit R [Bacteroidetes bacterium QS_9_68_14]